MIESCTVNRSTGYLWHEGVTLSTWQVLSLGDSQVIVGSTYQLSDVKCLAKC